MLMHVNELIIIKKGSVFQIRIYYYADPCGSGAETL